MSYFACIGRDQRNRQLHLLASIALAFVSIPSMAQEPPATKDSNSDPAIKIHNLVADANLMLRFLQSRDEQFDNMSIETELKWTDHIDPRQSELAELAKSPLPDPYEQPHRVRYVLTVRGMQTKLQSTGELDPILYPEYTYCESKNLKQTNVTGAECTYNEAEGGNESYFYESAITGEGLLGNARMRIEFSHGFGYAKHFTSIDSCKLLDGVLYISGPFHIGLHDNSYASLELDQSWIVRKAAITRRESGKELKISVATSGSRLIDGPLTIATDGHYLRTVTFPAKPEEAPVVATHNNEEYRFISISQHITDDVYTAITTITRSPSTLDISPNRKRTASPPRDYARTLFRTVLLALNLLAIILLAIWSRMKPQPHNSNTMPSSTLHSARVACSASPSEFW